MEIWKSRNTKIMCLLVNIYIYNECVQTCMYVFMYKNKVLFLITDKLSSCQKHGFIGSVENVILTKIILTTNGTICIAVHGRWNATQMTLQVVMPCGRRHCMGPIKNVTHLVPLGTSKWPKIPQMSVWY